MIYLIYVFLFVLSDEGETPSDINNHTFLFSYTWESHLSLKETSTLFVIFQETSTGKTQFN